MKFDEVRRLLIEIFGEVSVYETNRVLEQPFPVSSGGEQPLSDQPCHPCGHSAAEAWESVCCPTGRLGHPSDPQRHSENEIRAFTIFPPIQTPSNSVVNDNDTQTCQHLHHNIKCL